MFVDWKNQYCQDDYTTQDNLQIQCNPYQITSDSFSTELEQQQKKSQGSYEDTKDQE